MTNNETIKFKNAIEFYMLANNLKYATRDNKQSLADQIYGTMILAVAMNSEYQKTENIGEIIKTILLETLDFYYPNEVKKCTDKMSKKAAFITNSAKALNVDKSLSESSNFVFECAMAELTLEYFFENFLIEENIDAKNVDELYTVAKNYGLWTN